MLPCKYWINEKRYIVYNGPKYFLSNSTSNCSNIIAMPDKTLSTQKCDVNRSATEYIAVNMKEVAVNNTLEPSVERIGDNYIIECYGTNITIGNNNITCWNESMATSVQCNFSINDKTYLSRSEELEVQPHVLRLNITESVFANKQIDVISELVKNITYLAKSNDELAKSNSEHPPPSTFKFISENRYLLSGISSFTMIVIMIVVLSLVHICKKDPIVRMMEMQLVQSCLNEKKWKSAPVLEPGPTLTQSANYRSMWNFMPDDSPKTVVFAPENHMYPRLSRETTMRPLTPYPVGSVASLVSNSASEQGEAVGVIHTPHTNN